MFRWITRSRRRVSCVVVVLVVIVVTPPAWWAVQLAGLPDIGDPFDVDAFRAFTIPDKRNAFVLYRRAVGMLKPSEGYLKSSKERIGPLALWSEAGPDVRRWAEDNREALAVYRQGTERPDALDQAIGAEGVGLNQGLMILRLLVLLEASRREDQGDMAGAWGWYAAMLRTIHHVGMRGEVYRRNSVQRWWHRQLRDRMRAWADDKRTTPAMLRRALGDVIACEALVYSELDSLKTSYLDVNRLLDQPANPGREVPLGRFRQFYHPDYTLNPEQIQAIWDAWRSWRREPERSRRVIRLITANWLAYHELPPGRRPKPDRKVAALDLYPFGPEAPAQAVAPEALEHWLNTAYDAQQLLRYLDATGARVLEQANHAELVMILANELYRRDHGTDPPTPEALVGPYLERLPDEFRANAAGQPLGGAAGMREDR
jgi:hypothetical protein